MGVMSTVQTTDDYKIVSLPICIQCLFLFISFRWEKRFGHDRIWTCIPTAGFEPAIPSHWLVRYHYVSWCSTSELRGRWPSPVFWFHSRQGRFLILDAGYDIGSASKSYNDRAILILMNFYILPCCFHLYMDFGTVFVFALRLSLPCW